MIDRRVSAEIGFVSELLEANVALVTAIGGVK